MPGQSYRVGLCVTRERINTRDRVKGANIVHCTQAKYNFLLERNTTADKTGITALGNYAYSSMGAILDYLTDLVSCAWTKDGVCFAMVFSHPVYVVRSEVILGGGENGGGREDMGQVCDILVSWGIEMRKGTSTSRTNDVPESDHRRRRCGR